MAVFKVIELLDTEGEHNGLLELLSFFKKDPKTIQFYFQEDPRRSFVIPLHELSELLEQFEYTIVPTASISKKKWGRSRLV